MRTISRLCVAVLFSMVGAGGCSVNATNNSDGGPQVGSDGSSGSDASSSQGDGSSATGSEGGVGPDGGPVGQDGSLTQDGSGGQEAGAATDGGNAASGVHTVGNQLYDGTKAIRLLGVDETGSQYACIQGDGFFDPTTGGANSQTSITAMLSWGINAVRIPLNEDCWLSLNQTAKNMAYSGQAYQSAIQTYVSLLLTNNIYPILDLHWTEGPGGSAATGQQPMPDSAHGAAFWTSVATMFKSQNKVIFDLFNEPYPDNNMDSTGAWQCWENGGDSCPGVTFDVVGMQGMLTAVRNAGATNFVVMGGLEYSNDLTQWVASKPMDPANNIGVSWHVYNDNQYTTAAAITSILAANIPIVATEIGDVATPQPCNGTFITSVMDILDNPGNGAPPQSYLAWSWSTDNTPALLSSYNPVTPACDGPTFKTHVMAQ
jgi:hypothetical protein